ncbi:ligand-binding sensor domain-containing protein [Pedobacter sp. MW01-1-1]|uniref:ligand-binding sensor domain-containing protein n=1 Tax=Pedobacter sp. MW01-1-1 TaxID=3383027 RepID=UPI003FF0CD13
MQKRFRLTIAFLFLLILRLHAVDIQGIGAPYVENFRKATYAAGNQNWAIDKDKNGVMYFGNAEGLLAFDGRYWAKYKMPNKQIVRAIAVDSTGRIYVGSFGEFGFWSLQNNVLQFTSISKLLPKNETLNDEVWKIYIDKNQVIFQTFSRIYLYQNNQLQIVKSPNSPFLFLHKVDEHFYVEVWGKGLYELKEKKLIYLPKSDKLGGEGILSMLPYKNNQLLIGTSKNGLFLYNGADFIPFRSEASNFLKVYQLNNGFRVLGKYYAYGTILNGIIILDEGGRIVQRVNKSTGLQNNTVLSIYSDNEQNLWTGLDNGIDRIELNSSLYYHLDKFGLFGTVYSSIVYKGKIYLGTNQGLYYSDWQSINNQLKPLRFQLIPHSQGQVWDLSIIGSELICGHNNGTFRVIDNRIEKISDVSGGWTIKNLQSNYFVQGTYNGLSIFKMSAEGLKFVRQVEGFNAPSRNVEQDYKGDIWVSHAYKGLYRLKLSHDYTKATAIKYFDQKNGLPSTHNLNIFNLYNKILFSSDKGFYTYDEFSNKFQLFTSLNSKLGTFASSNKIIPAGDKKYWFINHGKTALVYIREPGKIEVDSNQFSQLDGRMVQYYENISQIDSSIYLISVDDGFVIYKPTHTPIPTKQNLPAVLIRQIDDITDKFSIISETNAPLKIANNRNNIRISFSLPTYRKSNIKFQFYLEGYSKEWSDWSYATEKDFTNLSAGKYVFKVRAKLNNHTLSEITRLNFTILPPWYLSNWAISFYILCIVIALILGKKIYERKLYKDREKISKHLQAEQEELFRKEADANEKQIAKLQTEKLQTELASKNRELANSAMSLVYKNELLQKLSEEVAKLKDEEGKRIPDDQTRKIQKVIIEGMNDERDWNLFENSFNEAHESFFKKLKAQYPDLVPNDLKLCAYLRMNMSSKEMSSLLNITLRGIEIRRYRLRKKLQISHEKNLTEFLMEL